MVVILCTSFDIADSIIIRGTVEQRRVRLNPVGLDTFLLVYDTPAWLPMPNNPFIHHADVIVLCYSCTDKVNRDV